MAAISEEGNAAKVPEAGGQGWLIPMTGGANLSLDPCATAALGGRDAESRGSASLRVPGGGVPPRDVRPALQPDGALLLHFQGGAGLKYEIQRSAGLGAWTTVAQVTADGAGKGLWRDGTPPAGRAFYRVAGPLP